MRLCIDRSSELAPLSAFRSWLDCTINTSGYDFRKGHFAAAASLQKNGVSRCQRLTVAAMLAIPTVVSCGLGYWLLRDASATMQNAALAVIVGILLVTTIEDVIPEGDASPRLPRWVSTAALAGGFAGLALLSTYFG